MLVAAGWWEEDGSVCEVGRNRKSDKLLARVFGNRSNAPTEEGDWVMRCQCVLMYRAIQILTLLASMRTPLVGAGGS